jgi:hypothetical protein
MYWLGVTSLTSSVNFIAKLSKQSELSAYYTDALVEDQHFAAESIDLLLVFHCTIGAAP